MKSIILIAAPAAGKGTEAAVLKEQYNMPHISTGDMLREKAQEDSDLGRDINYKINNGIFVSDELIIEILKERIITSRPKEWADKHLEKFDENKLSFEPPSENENAIIINNY